MIQGLATSKIQVNLTTTQVNATENLGEFIGRHLLAEMVVLLIGNLGAGKTTLSRGLARGWGSDMRVTSPTFKLVNIYTRSADDQMLHHLDCYRLGSSDEGETIGLGDILADDGPVIIEWPTVIEDWLPDERLIIEFEDINFDIDIDGINAENMTQRHIQITGIGKRYKPLMDGLRSFV